MRMRHGRAGRAGAGRARRLTIGFLAGIALTATFAVPAGARPQACLTSVRGAPVALMYDTTDGIVRENRSYRERLFGRFGRIDCPGYVTLRAMTPDLTDEERALFCLEYDRRAGTYSGFVVGDRDAFVGCREPSGRFCERLTTTADEALALARFGAGLAGQAAGTGMRVAEDPSGAILLSGGRAYVAGALGSVAATVAGALSSPATLTAAAVTVVAVGGAVYVCGG
jgi:hypothetical protein